MSWVDITQDSEAAEFVASYHGGNETTPTAITGAGQMINATPGAIKAHLSEAAASRPRRRRPN